MTQIPTPRWLIASLAALLATLTLVQARVGESQTQLESRLLSDRTAVKIPSRDVTAKLEHRSVPYRGLLRHLPQEFEHVIYYKPAERARASRADLSAEFPEGWEVHVIYHRGRSLFEAYRRNGAGITRYEEEGILLLNRRDSYWKRIPQDQARDTAIGYNYELDDGTLRAFRQGPYLIIYNAEMDKKLKEAIDAIRAEERAEADALAQQKAPDSLQGF